MQERYHPREGHPQLHRFRRAGSHQGAECVVRVFLCLMMVYFKNTVCSFSDNSDTEFSIKVPDIVVRGMYMVADRSDPDLLTPATTYGNFTLTASKLSMCQKIE